MDARERERLARLNVGPTVCDEYETTDPLCLFGQHVLQRAGRVPQVDASGHQPRDVRNVDLAGFEMVIAIGSNAADVVEALGIPKSKLIMWSIPDPWGGDLTEYADAALAIRKHLARLR